MFYILHLTSVSSNWERSGWDEVPSNSYDGLKQRCMLVSLIYSSQRGCLLSSPKSPSRGAY